MINKKFFRMSVTKNSPNIFTVLFAFSFLFFLSSCAQKLSFATSQVVPAAKGSVKIKSDKNNNNSVSLSVRNLADPNRLTPPKKVYVVWMETAANGTKNIGSLNTSGGLFSRSGKSSINTVTPFKPVSFFITAEDDATLRYPSGTTVLKTN